MGPAAKLKVTTHVSGAIPWDRPRGTNAKSAQ
jgi:hypothetical protein